MPSHRSIPTLFELESAFHAAAHARREDADGHTGSLYDYLAGVGALVFRGLSARERDHARKIYLSGAKDAELDRRVLSRRGVTRNADQRGTGIAYMTRVGTAGTTIWRWTRILVSLEGQDPIIVRASSDYTVLPGVTSIPLPVEQEISGLSADISVIAVQCRRLELLDLLEDTWTITKLVCTAGQAYEKDEAYLARANDTVLEERVGYESAIEHACRDAGASRVALFRSDYTGIDTGINNVIVGDAGGETPDAILLACRLALARVAILGVNAQALPMTRQQVELAVDVELWQPTSNPRESEIEAANAIIDYFQNRHNPFVWKYSAVEAAALKGLSNVHTIAVSGTEEPVLATLFTPPVVEWEACAWNITVQITVAA